MAPRHHRALRAQMLLLQTSPPTSPLLPLISWSSSWTTSALSAISLSPNGDCRANRRGIATERVARHPSSSCRSPLVPPQRASFFASWASTPSRPFSSLLPNSLSSLTVRRQRQRQRQRHNQHLQWQPRHDVRSNSNSSSSSASSRPPSTLRHSTKDPLDDYYALLLAQPLPVDATSSNPSAAPAVSSPPVSSDNLSTASTIPTDLASRARVVFGSRLAGPGERVADRAGQKARGEGEWIGGAWIPPRPPEPDNCCMSGCVNCVWDLYRDELEEWAGTRRAAVQKGMVVEAQRASTSVDEDGGGSEALWSDSGSSDSSAEGSQEDLFSGVPVGIREFMKSEKRLKEQREKRQQEATA